MLFPFYFSSFQRAGGSPLLNAELSCKNGKKDFEMGLGLVCFLMGAIIFIITGLNYIKRMNDEMKKLK